MHAEARACRVDGLRRRCGERQLEVLAHALVRAVQRRLRLVDDRALAGLRRREVDLGLLGLARGFELANLFLLLEGREFLRREALTRVGGGVLVLLERRNVMARVASETAAWPDAAGAMEEAAALDARLDGAVLPARRLRLFHRVIVRRRRRRRCGGGLCG